MSARLNGKRAVVTEANNFMGPAVAALFRDEGAQVFTDERDLRAPKACEALIVEAGTVDILVVNLSVPNPRKPAHITGDDDWDDVFARLVKPMHQLVRAALPQMLERRSGKIIVVGSASALRGSKNRSCYGAARGAQHAYVRNVGIEVAPFNVQVNATGQIYVENPTYYPPERIATPDLQQQIQHVPAGRLSTGPEAASLIAYLASEDSNFICGQVFPYAGGWTA